MTDVHRPTIVIPMAGYGRRFSQYGYETPKHALDLSGRPLFDWSVGSFERYAATHPYVIVLRRDPLTRDFVEERLNILKVSKAEIVELEGPTRGQAETVLLGINEAAVSDRSPIAIFNVDTIRPGLRLPNRAALDRAAGFVEVFAAPGDGWSFVRVDDSDAVTEVREKDRISDHACTGLYVFSAAGDFRQAYATPPAARTAAEQRERYVAPLYNHLLANGRRVETLRASASDVIPCGVPEEYRALLTSDVAYPHRW